MKVLREHRFKWNKDPCLKLDRLYQKVTLVWYNDLRGRLRLWKQSEEYGFLTEAKAQTLQQLKDPCRGFSDAFDVTRPGKRPLRFKELGIGDSFRFPQGVKMDSRQVFLPKVGWVGFFKIQDIPGTTKQAMPTREANGWFVSTQTETVIADPPPRSVHTLGVDRGVAVFATTSNGERIEAQNAGKRLADQLRRPQRRLERHKEGSRNRAETKRRIARLHPKIVRLPSDVPHKRSTRWSDSHALIILTDLRIGNLTRLAKGTVEEPRRNVTTKSGLNRSILDQGWGAFAKRLGYKLAARGRCLMPVPAHHPSQTCSACGRVDPASRPSRDAFRRTARGHADHADIHAAKVIPRRGLAA